MMQDIETTGILACPEKGTQEAGGRGWDGKSIWNVDPLSNRVSIF